MSIRSNIEDIAKLAENDAQLSGEIQDQAMAALKFGQGSQEWETYMEQFSQTPEQLARLLATDNSANLIDMDIARAKLARNGTCGATTVGFLVEGIDDKLDEGLS